MMNAKKHIIRLLLLCGLAVSAASHAANPLLQTPFLTPSGEPARFAPLQGQYTVVNFWATWCAPCRIEMPLLSRKATEWQSRGIRFVGIALDQPDPVLAYLKQQPVSYPILMSDADGIELMRQLGNKSGGLPFTVILDKQGKPVRQLLGLVEEKQLRSILRIK